MLWACLKIVHTSSPFHLLHAYSSVVDPCTRTGESTVHSAVSVHASVKIHNDLQQESLDCVEEILLTTKARKTKQTAVKKHIELQQDDVYCVEKILLTTKAGKIEEITARNNQQKPKKTDNKREQREVTNKKPTDKK